LVPILGDETPWYRCWVDEDTEETDEFFRQDYVFCEMTPPAHTLGIQYISVQLFTADGGIAEVMLSADEPLAVVKKVNGPAYPLEVQTTVHVTNFEQAFNYQGINVDYKTSHTLERNALPTKDLPLVVTQPFDLWPVEVTVATRAVSLAFDSYTLELMGGLQVDDASSLDVTIRSQSSGRENDVMKLLLPVASQAAVTSFSGTGQFYRDSLPFTIDGPGRYLADSDGLQAL
tara:strand:+ start:41863 stop:42555 length:693 start_codon:yes stop_codon:yes gene_type:complete